MKSLLGRDAIRHRYNLSPTRLATLLTDPDWCTQHGIRPAGMIEKRPVYDAATAARIAHCYRETPHRSRGAAVQHPANGWRCLHCGAVLRDPRCLGCEVSHGRGRDLRAVRLRPGADASHLVCSYMGNGMDYGPVEDRTDALRHEPLEDQYDMMLGLLRRNLDRGELRFGRKPIFARRLQSLGWDGELPWDAVTLLVRRVCGYCGHAAIGLDHILRRDGDVDLERLERLKACSQGCCETEPPPDGWQDRLAEVRVRKQAAGEMA